MVLLLGRILGLRSLVSPAFHFVSHTGFTVGKAMKVQGRKMPCTRSNKILYARNQE